SWPCLARNFCATSCSATGINIAANSACTFACSTSRCRQAGGLVLTNRRLSYRKRNRPSDSLRKKPMCPACLASAVLVEFSPRVEWRQAERWRRPPGYCLRGREPKEFRVAKYKKTRRKGEIVMATASSKIGSPKVVPPAEWLSARTELLKKE